MERDNKLIRSIIETAKTGNRAALQQLYSVSVDRVFGIILRILPEEADAEKLTREILVNALHSISKIQEDEIYSLWLTRITIRTVLSKVKNNEVKVNREELRAKEESAEQRQGIRFVGNVALEGSILSLPINERIAFVLNELGGCSTIDIAGILNLSHEDTNDLLNVAKGLLITEFNKSAGNTEKDFIFAEKFFMTQFVSLQKKIIPMNDLWPSIKQALDDLRMKSAQDIGTNDVVKNFGDNDVKVVKVSDKGELKKKPEQRRILEETKSSVSSGSSSGNKKSPAVIIMIGVIIFLLVMLIVFLMM